MKKTLLLSFAFFVAFFATAQKLPFQGKLIEAGVPVNGTHNFSFSIDTLWVESHSNVTVTDGLYFVVLGSINPLPAAIFSGTNERQLTLSVDGIALSPVTLYKPLSGDLSQLNIKGSGNGSISGGFGKGSAVNENLPSLKLNGNLPTLNNRVTLRVSSNNDNSVESGAIDLSSTTGNLSYWSSDYFGLHYGNTPNVQFFSQNWSGKGHTGYMVLRGPNTVNIEIGSQFWQNSDLPWMNMRGTSTDPNNPGLVQLSGAQYDDNGIVKERGQLVLHDSDEKRGFFNSSEIMLLKPDWSPFVSLSSNGDAGRLQLNGTNSQVTVNNAENLQKAVFGMAGNDNLSAMLRMAGPDAHFALDEELYSPNPPKVFIDIENGTNGNFGRLFLSGPNKSNIEMGGDYPNIQLRGTENQTTVSIGCNSDAEERGYIIFRNKSNTEEMFMTSNAIGGNAVLNIWNGLNVLNGATINGTLELNGNFTGSGTQTYTSDQRLKKDIQPLGENILGKIESIESVSYFWRKDEFPQKNFSDDQQIGLIAQQLEAQFPALVKTNDDGYKAVNYNGFTAVLLQAVKELNVKVEKLETENRVLQAELSASATQSDEMTELKNQVDFLTKLVQEKLTSVTNDSEKTAEKK
jgi:hypothetical protein